MLRCLVLAAVLMATVNSATAGTSNSLLDVSSDGKRLLAANVDNGTVTVVDLKTLKVEREISVGKRPEGVSWIGDSSLAIVTCYLDRAVVVIDTAKGEIIRKIPTAAEPYGVVVDAAGKRAFVSHEYPGVVSEIDLDTGKVLREIPSGSMPRGIALSPDGKRVYVSAFYTGVLSAIDLASGKIVDSWKGHSTDNLARHVQLHPTRPKAYLAHIRSIVHVNHGDGSIFPQMSVCDLKPGEGRRRVSIGMDTFNGVYVTTNAWESTISPDGKRFYIVYAGTNDMNVCDVVDDDYKEIERYGNAVRVGKNPRAVRVSTDNKQVFIYNTLDFSVGVYSASTMGLVTSIKVCDPPKTPEWVEGKILFNSSQPPMSSRRWVSCSSCHPDGHHDARTWQQPEGKRKTTALFGMAHTHPLHWSADRDEVQDFEYTLRSPLMQGAGLTNRHKLVMKPVTEKPALEMKTSGLSTKLDNLAIYSNSFDFPLSPHVETPGKLPEAALRGKEIFHNKEVGCATCHSGPYYSDSSLQKPYKLHDIGTGKDDKTEKMEPAYDTPTLLGIYRTAPYLHHGKATTLHEVFTKYNPSDKHGKTSQLSKDELNDLVEFLKCLPYETPPSVTPNTVPHRLIPAELKKS